jgi:hypothetical protein
MTPEERQAADLLDRIERLRRKRRSGFVGRLRPTRYDHYLEEEAQLQRLLDDLPGDRLTER